jgi:hypothetical protein
MLKDILELASETVEQDNISGRIKIVPNKVKPKKTSFHRQK